MFTFKKKGPHFAAEQADKQVITFVQGEGVGRKNHLQRHKNS